MTSWHLFNVNGDGRRNGPTLIQTWIKVDHVSKTLMISLLPHRASCWINMRIDIELRRNVADVTFIKNIFNNPLLLTLYRFTISCVSTKLYARIHHGDILWQQTRDVKKIDCLLIKYWYSATQEYIFHINTDGFTGTMAPRQIWGNEHIYLMNHITTH